MKVLTVDIDGTRENHITEYDGETGTCEFDYVLYIPVPWHVSVRELDSLLKEIPSELRRAGELVVLRLHPRVAEELLEDEIAVGALRDRFEGLPITIARLAPDRSIELTSVSETAVPAHDPGQILAAVRFAELDSWLKQPGVVLPANEDFDYEGPNGYRYKSFMRVGTAIQGMDTLDAAAFWLQPHLRGRPVVVHDAWTIKSVGLNLSRYAAHAGDPCEPVADVECLGAYDEDMERLRGRLKAACDRAPAGTPALLVSSVVSKGNLHRMLESLIAEMDFEEVRSVALYGSAECDCEVFCRPAAVGHYWKEEGEEGVPKTPAITIAPATYLMDVPLRPQLADIKGVNAKQAAEFFERYEGGDFLTVHRDEPDRDRHHMIHIDVEALMREPAFSERLDERLVSLRPDVVLAPRDPAAKALALEVGRRLQIEPIIANEDELPDLADERRERLRAASQILLVDDVVISGDRLLGYRNFLRRCDYVSAERRPEIHLLVGVARARDNLAIKGIEDMVDNWRRFHPVETLLLPDWDSTECPWCWELQMLEEFGHEATATERLEQRWEALMNGRQGLKHSLFIPWKREGMDPLPVPVWELGPGSVFPSSTQVEFFAGVASAVQSLRSAARLSNLEMYPLAQVLDPRFWISGRYYDSVIVAAILRATRRHDVRAAQIAPELRRGVSRRLQNNDDLQGELILAAARGQLPAVEEMGVGSKRFVSQGADPGFASLLSRAFEARPTP